MLPTAQRKGPHAQAVSLTARIVKGERLCGATFLRAETGRNRIRTTLSDAWGERWFYCASGAYVRRVHFCNVRLPIIYERGEQYSAASDAMIVEVLELGNVAPLAGRDAVAAQLDFNFTLKRLAQVKD